MAKRGATSDLNDRNWDDEEEPEEAGVFVQADEETLQQRVIKRAKRRGAGTGDSVSKPTAFSGFGGLTGVSASSNTFANFKSTSSIGSSFPTLAPGAKSATQSVLGGASSSSNQPLNGTNNNKEIAKGGNSGSKEGKDSSAYFSFLKSLNQSVLAWIKQHVEENPYIILTPVFKDYEKYLAKHASENKPCTVASSLSPLSSATKKDIKDTNSSTKPVSTTDTKNGEGSKGFLFGGSPLTKGAEGSISEKNETVETSAKSVTDTSKGFSLSSNPPFSGTGGFSFSGNTMKTTSANSTTTSTLGTSGFSFTASTTNSAPSTGFSFGATSTSAPSSGFTFGTQLSTATTGFSFGAAASQAATSDDKNGEEEYVPPVPEVKEIKEDDALYSKRCKLYFQRQDQWIDRGVGNIHLKPVEDTKTQILIRADTNLGNILLNVMLSESMPVSRQGKNNVFLVCVPNPPLDSKADEEEQKKPVSMLVRVKTGEDADELFKFIQERKALI